MHRRFFLEDFDGMFLSFTIFKDNKHILNYIGSLTFRYLLRFNFKLILLDSQCSILFLELLEPLLPLFDLFSLDLVLLLRNLCISKYGTLYIVNLLPDILHLKDKLNVWQCIQAQRDINDFHWILFVYVHFYCVSTQYILYMSIDLHLLHS